MALPKVTYVNGVTQMNAANLNQIQDAIITLEGQTLNTRLTAAEGDIDTLEGKVATLEGQTLNTRLTTAEGKISTIETKLTDTLMTVNYTCDYDLEAGDNLNFNTTNLGITTPTGYTPIAFTRILTGDTNVQFRSMFADATGSSSVVSLHNFGSSSVSATLQVKILYAKTGVM